MGLCLYMCSVESIYSRQVSVCTGHNKLTIFCCTNVHMGGMFAPRMGPSCVTWRHESKWAHNKRKDSNALYEFLYAFWGLSWISITMRIWIPALWIMEPMVNNSIDKKNWKFIWFIIWHPNEINGLFLNILL